MYELLHQELGFTVILLLKKKKVNSKTYTTIHSTIKRIIHFVAIGASLLTLLYRLLRILGDASIELFP